MEINYEKVQKVHEGILDLLDKLEVICGGVVAAGVLITIYIDSMARVLTPEKLDAHTDFIKNEIAQRIASAGDLE